MRAHDVGSTPRLPDRIGDLGVHISHHCQQLLPLLLGLGFQQALIFEVRPQLVIVPCRIYIVLPIVSCPGCIFRSLRNDARQGLAHLVRPVPIYRGARLGGERARSVSICAVLALCEEDELFTGALWGDHALFEEELAETRLVPCVKSGVADICKGLLGVGVSVVGPRRGGVPV